MVSLGMDYSPFMRDELSKLALAPGAGARFLEGAKGELGPAVGATLGAGLAGVYGKNPLSGAGLGYGIGSIPEMLLSRKKHAG